MSPLAWAIRPLKRYAEFSGRSPRAEFWWFFLFTMVIYLLVWFVLIGSIGASMSSATSGTEPSVGMLGALGVGVIFIGLFWLALIVPTIALQVRRIHDLDRSGWWIGGYYLLYVLYMVMSLGTVFAAAAGSTDPSGVGIGGMIGSMIVGLAFLIYSIALLVFFCTQGTKGPNRYGADPYGEDVAQVFA